MKSVKRISVLLIVCLLAVSTQAYPIMVDDFANTGLGEYTLNWMLEQSGYHGITFASPSGVLQVSKEADSGAEQVSLLRDDYSLAVGEILRVDTSGADIPSDGPYADFGIAVAKIEDLPDCAWTSGTADARDGYLAVYLKPKYDSIGWAGYDGGNVGSSSGVGVTWADITGLYISRTSDTTFEGGYTTAAGYTKLVDWTVTNTDIGNAIGFYADVRNTTTYGDLDNLRIVPEPATLTMLGLGASLILRRRKR